jgi:hypothetical protein
VFTVDRGIFFVVVDFLVYFLASIIDYLIFIVLIFVLKEVPAPADEDQQ